MKPALQLAAADDFLEFGTELVTTMAKALVNHPEEITIETIVGENTTVFKIHAAPGDLGQIIGKKGVNISHLREVLKIYSSKSKRRAVLELADAAHQTVYQGAQQAA
jgi:predicted RNA-binding protein YlqC (UPF0109 family)